MKSKNIALNRPGLLNIKLNLRGYRLRLLYSTYLEASYYYFDQRWPQNKKDQLWQKTLKVLDNSKIDRRYFYSKLALPELNRFEVRYSDQLQQDHRYLNDEDLRQLYQEYLAWIDQEIQKIEFLARGLRLVRKESS